MEGILPLAKSSFDPYGNLSLDWVLPGHGEAYADCGSWRKRGCLQVSEHVQDGLEEVMIGKVYVEFYKRSCARASCPKCYESWAAKEGHKIAHRIGYVGRSFGKVIHLTASPSKHDVLTLPYQKLRSKAYRIARKSGFRGGMAIFHPWREDQFGLWYFSPHFHFIGFGWIVWRKEDFVDSGWIIKNMGVRESVFATAFYQLSHCGLNSEFHSVTWFGKLSYNKLKVPPLPEKEDGKCPICGNKLRELLYIGELELIPVKRGWFDPEGWILRPSCCMDGG